MPDKPTIKGPVLVTGGTGFIGRAVINRLLHDRPGIELRSFSLPGEAAPAHWQDRVKGIHGDITSSEDVDAATQGAATIIHLAALLGAGDYDKHLRVTAGGTENVLKAALRNDARVVVASSIAVYGEYVRDRVCDESEGHGPQYSPYCLAKQEQENITLRYVNEHGLRASIARPANVTGAGSLPWVDVVGSALQLGVPLIVDGGTGNAGLVHANDVATGLIAIAARGGIGEAYNLCSDMRVSWRRYFGDIARLAGLSPPASGSYAALYKAARQFEVPERQLVPEHYTTLPLATLTLIGSDNRFPIAKLRSELGWRPAIDYAGIIADIRRYLASH
jgi:UDP-glucose 4-epimerase